MTIKVAILSGGKSKKEALEKHIEIYKTRMKKRLFLEEKKLVVSQIISRKKEGKSGIYIALDPTGQELTSEAFAEKLIQWTTYKQIYFMIGEAEGLSKEALMQADFRLSLSKMVFPHQIARLLLVEQLYRAYSLQEGKKYHK